MAGARRLSPPVIGPAQVGSYRSRPWGAGRPDIVLFVADTFRADNLESDGGKLAVAPFLDRLATRSLHFRNARSVSTHTLPAHASMFTGLYPYQVGIPNDRVALPEGAFTVAELLEREGYRTAAVTDSALVSQRRGLAQGFEWFDELHRDVASTLARAGDGWPTDVFSRLAPEAEALLVPQLEPVPVVLEAKDAEALRALGYLQR